MSLSKKLILFWILINSVACRQDPSPASRPDYMALTEEDPRYYDSLEHLLLISKSHQTIKYTIRVLKEDFNQWMPDMPQDTCVSLADGKRFTESSINVWLNALQDEARNGKVTLKATLGKPSYTEKLDEADITVYFSCEIGRSFFSFDSELRPFIKFSPKDFDYGVNDALQVKNSANQKLVFNLSVLFHEFGHAFGLSDQYVDTGDGRKGKLPNHALMSDSFVRTLTPDDRAGIVWLYQNTVLKTVADGTCLEGFERDTATNGCYLAKGQNFWANEMCHHSGGMPTDQGCYCLLKLTTYDPQYKEADYCHPLDQIQSAARRTLSRNFE